MIERVNQINARWSFRASFVNVIKTENSLYLTNEDKWDIYLYDFFHYLGVQSAPEVGPTNYETPYISRIKFFSSFLTHAVSL